MAGFSGVVYFDSLLLRATDLARVDEAARFSASVGETVTWVGEPARGVSAAMSRGAHGPDSMTRGDSWALCAGRLDNWDEISSLCRRVGESDPPRPDQPRPALGVLAAYEKWGEDCASHLLGDFAFVVWDGAKKRLLCGRDPGQAKALYYSWNGRCFRFAHDPRALLDAPEVSRDFDAAYLTTYMVMGNLNGERTPFAAVKQLAGGSALCVENGALRTWKWWRLPEAGSLSYSKLDDYYQHLRALMDDAVRVRLRGATTVSLALSRGIDSASIATSAARLLRRGEADCEKFQCLTFAAPHHREADECVGASAIARHLGLSHRIVTAADALYDLDAALGQLAEPSGMVMHWNDWDAARRACVDSQSAVLLTGIGGELFESPYFYLADLIRGRQWGTWMRELWNWKRAGTSVAGALKITLHGLQEHPVVWQPDQKIGFYPWLRQRQLCQRDFSSLSLSHPVARDLFHTFVEKGGVLGALQPLFEPSGIEVRNPLCDHRLIEFAAALPLERRLRREMPDGRLMNKPLLRHAFASQLPFHLTGVSGRLRAQMGQTLHEHHERVRHITQHPPLEVERALSEVIDFGILREHLHQLQHDTGRKRYVALTSVLVRWLHSQSESQPSSSLLLAGSNARSQEVKT